MKLMWLCNLAPGAVREQISGKRSSGLWMDHVLTDLRAQKDLKLHILCPGETAEGKLDETCSYGCFTEGLPYKYLPIINGQQYNSLDCPVFLLQQRRKKCWH